MTDNKNNSLQLDEQALSPRALAGTILVHLLLLLLFLFYSMRTQTPIPKEQGILINFGQSFKEGSGDIQPQSTTTAAKQSENLPPPAKAATPPPPSKPAPQPEKAKVQKPIKKAEGKAPSLPDKKEKKKPKKPTKDKKPPKKETTKPPTPQPDKKTNNSNNTASNTANNTSTSNNTPEPKKEEEPKKVEINKDALFPGSSNSNSTSQGNTNTAGDLGSKMGEVQISDNTGTQSPGLGKSGISFNLSGRSLLQRPKINENSQEVGTVIVKVKVDRQGNVIDAVYSSAGSTTASAVLRNKAVAAAKQAKFNVDPQANEIQVGTMSFVFKVK